MVDFSFLFLSVMPYNSMDHGLVCAADSLIKIRRIRLHFSLTVMCGVRCFGTHHQG